MKGHKIVDHSLIHDRMHGKTIHEDMHKKNIHSDMHIGHMHFGHSSDDRNTFGHSSYKH